MFALSKPQFMQLISEGKITQQGGAGGQVVGLAEKDSRYSHRTNYWSGHGHGQISEYHIALTDFVTANLMSHELYLTMRLQPHFLAELKQDQKIIKLILKTILWQTLQN